MSTSLDLRVYVRVWMCVHRLGIFNTTMDYLKEKNKGGPVPLVEKAGAGLVAGGLGAIFGSPADLSLIRMQADGTLPVAWRSSCCTR